MSAVAMIYNLSWNVQIKYALSDLRLRPGARRPAGLVTGGAAAASVKCPLRNLAKNHDFRTR